MNAKTMSATASMNTMLAIAFVLFATGFVLIVLSIDSSAGSGFILAGRILAFLQILAGLLGLYGSYECSRQGDKEPPATLNNEN